jgi:5-methylcytosine-specific restriction endonuclease McrA
VSYQKPVLVLNASFEAINVCSMQRAIILTMKGLASVEESYPDVLHTKYADFPMPSVIRLHKYRNVPRQSKALSRKNILMRDMFTCQYCEGVFSANDLTLDHIHPKSKGGGSTWENLVACCFKCNNKKGSHTPEEVGMKLLRKPKPFTLHTSRHLMRQMGKNDAVWQKYLFY